MRIVKLTNHGRTPATGPLIIASLSFIVVVVIGYFIYSSLNSHSSKTTQLQPATSNTNSKINTTYAILKPATVPSKVAECSANLTYASDGNPSPLQCPNGDLNVLAWNSLSALEPKVMKLGYNPSQTQVENAICKDGNAADVDSAPTILAPIETSIYQISSLYYGWHFSINPAQLLASGC